MEMDDLLTAMDRTGANLAKLEDIWRRAALRPLSHSGVASYVAPHTSSSSDTSRRYDYKRRLLTTQRGRNVPVKNLTQRVSLSNARVAGQKAARTRNRNRSLALRPPPAHPLNECSHYAAL